MTDILTFFEFIDDGNNKWAKANLGFIFLPSVLRFFTSMFQEISRKPKQDDVEIASTNIRATEKEKSICMRVLTIPLEMIKALPGLQTLFAIKRFFTLRDQLVHTSDPAKLEETFKESAQLKVYEAFAEAGPTQVLNMYIFLLTGNISELQILSMVFSTLSLSMSGTANFFLFRNKQEEDAKPSFPFVVLTFIPMLLNTIASALLWSILASFSSGLIYLSIGLVFAVTFVSLKIHDCFMKSKKIQTNHTIAELAIINTFQPTGVGKHSSMFITAAIASYGTRLILIIFLWIFQSYQLNHILGLGYVWTPPLITCITNETFLLYFNLTKTQTCDNLQTCFCWTSCESSVREKIR